MKQEAQITKRENAGPLATNVFEADAGQGIANIKQEDLALPFLKVLGQLSPEVNKRDAKYVEGAQPGMIVNSVTNELYDGEKGIQVLQSITKDNIYNGKIEVKVKGLLSIFMTQETIYLKLQETKVIRID